MVEVELAAPPAAQAILDLMEQFYAEARYPFDREKARAALEPFLADPSLGRAWLFRDGAAAVGYFFTSRSKKTTSPRRSCIVRGDSRITTAG